MKVKETWTDLYLKTFHLLPLRLRFFVKFIFFDLGQKQKRSIEIYWFKKNRATRSPFHQPIFTADLYKFSFLSLSIRLLNSFIYSYFNHTVIAFDKIILALGSKLLQSILIRILYVVLPMTTDYLLYSEIYCLRITLTFIGIPEHSKENALKSGLYF